MPVGRAPSMATSDAVFMAPTGVAVGESSGLVAGSAVCVVSNQGVIEYRLASAQSNLNRYNFFGFAGFDASSGSKTIIAVGRGSYVTPIFEQNDNPIPDQVVYLGTTPGRVTVNCPSAPGSVIVKIGIVITPTKIMLLPDMNVFGI